MTINNAIHIIGTIFTSNERFGTLIKSDIQIILVGPIIFHNNNHVTILDAPVQFKGYIEASDNEAMYFLSTPTDSNANLISNTILNITCNTFLAEIFHKEWSRDEIIPACYFQFYSSGSKNSITTKSYQIAIVDNIGNPYYPRLKVFSENIQNINCKMFSDSVFYRFNPLEVYKSIIDYKNETEQLFDTGLLCHCSSEGKQNCQTDTLGPIYAGQLLTLNLRSNNNINTLYVNVDMYHSYLPPSHCKVSSTSETFNVVRNSCTQLRYTILSADKEQCELVFSSKYVNTITIFYIKLYKCPVGFSLNNNTEACDCDPVLKKLVLKCNINDQTVLRHANCWISAESHNNHHNYQTSHHCPFHYCLPHSSTVNFSTPNSQCQFNRAGILCGQCQQNLSTIFGSSQCQHCSNITLLLILPIIIAGILLVLLLFLLNLTVTDGTINAFIMYANIISINNDVFFDTDEIGTPAYTFISLANFDLGIKICFYNGMDDFAKIWLQLAFPFYLIFIATSLIIVSRYSTTIQRITARRALPVLDTLFLLSYTKILHTVSNVLFFYSTVTHLPSKHTTLVWSVDTNVSLFGVKFAILFITCVVLFLVLLSFNIVLLFTRTLMRFQSVNRFKPLLDAYQGPYKDHYYYWTGLQLLIRAVFFGIAALDKKICLIIGAAVTSGLIGLHGFVGPFKSKIKNFQELLFALNLQLLYIFTLSGLGATAVNVMVTIAAIHFIIICMATSNIFTCAGVIVRSNPYHSNCMNSIVGWITKLHMKPKIEPDEILTLNNIPEVAYNYHEYQEPLIGVDM